MLQRLLLPLAAAATLLAAVTFIAPSPAPTREKRPARPQSIPGQVHTLYGNPHDANYSYGLSPSQLKRFSASRANATATFQVTYEGAFNSPGAGAAQAKAAFEAGLNIWANLITSSQVIRVQAFYQDLGLNPTQQVLGLASPGASCEVSAPGALPKRYYAAPLADQLSGADVCAKLSDSVFDIVIFLNKSLEINAEWDFSTNGVPQSGKFSFMTATLHEMAHGLGIDTSAQVAPTPSGVIEGVWGDIVKGVPNWWDTFIENGNEQRITNLSIFPNPSAALAAEYVSNNLFFASPTAIANNDGVKPKIESKLNPFLQRVSLAHLDEDTYSLTPNGLMTRALNTAEVYTDPGPIVRGILIDEGWGTIGPPVVPCNFTISPTSVSVSSQGGTSTVTVTAPTTCDWTATSNASFITITNGATGTGPGTVTYSVAPGTAARTGTLTIATKTFTVSQTAPPTVPCMYTLLSNAAQVAAGGGTGGVSVLAPAGCGWTAVSNNSFITVTAGALGNGTGTVSYSVGVGLTTPRTGTMTIAGQTFTITQDACLFSLSSSSIAVPLAGTTSSVGVTASAGCTWTAAPNDSFITVTSGAAGTGSGTVTYSVALAAASRVGTMTIATNTFTVSQTSLPILSLAPSPVYFGAEVASGAIASASPAQTIALTQQNSGPFTWTASSNQPWLMVTPASGTGPATLTLSINTLAAVTVAGGTGTITVSGLPGGAANNPSASVVLSAFPRGLTAAATGSIDTPTTGQTGVTGSIAVTGWALDDIGVQRVRIFRDPLVGEGPNRVFIGDATFVAGARPDVAALFPSTPLSNRAGWGYLMLTNFLPSQGNGTFTISAFADDFDGHSTLLGSKTISCANATATTPFGAIDTPAQGGTVSGTFLNFGWALTPPPASIAANESTISVLVDSVSIGSPTDGGPLAPRSDIQALFGSGGYANINSSVGLKTINSLTLSNGVHTIAWIVSDSLGRSAGIGSRFFTVANSSVVAGVTADDSFVAQGFSLAPESGVIDATRSIRGDASSLADLSRSGAAIAVTRGFDAGAIPDAVMPDGDGVRQLRVAQLERVAFDVNAHGDEDATYDGYTVDGAMLRELPAGSHLDAHTGAFAWMPGLAFGGVHDLVFVKTCAHGTERIDVRVTIEAQAVAAGDPRMVIDTPGTGTTVGARFTIAGWAVDPHGPANGAGIDTMHVWAYPVDGGDAIWVGVAAYGGLRPDVADLLGPRFGRSGFSIDVANLAPGTYDVVVYAHSLATGRPGAPKRDGDAAREGGFSLARTVRVTIP